MHTGDGIRDRDMALKIDFGSKQKVLITEVTENGKFFLQLDTPEAHGLSELSETIRASVEVSPEPLLHPEVGLKCYAQSAFDGVWYRALITAVSGGEIQVYYVDYGNTESVPASNLSCPSGDLFDLPYQAVCCVLGDFTPRGGQWSLEATDGLREVVPIETEFAAVFRSRNSSQKHPVYPSLPCFNVALFSDPDTDLSVAQDLVGRGLGQYCICAENISVGSTMNMFTCSIDSPGMFWLHVSDKLEPINAVSDCLNNQETISSLKLLPSSSLFPTAACCTHFSEDGMLYRSEIIRVESDKVDVRYVDYGNCDTVDVQNVLEIPADLVLQPAFAIQCCLDGVKPHKPKDRRVQSGPWSTEACDKFAELSEGRELEVEVVSEITPEVFSVRLRDATSGDDIGQVLAREGYAELPEPAMHPKKKPTPQIQYVELQVGQRYQVIVTHADSPAVLWCQRTEYSLEFEHLTADLQTKHTSFRPLGNPTVGQGCCQLFYEDNTWCRGRVESVDATSRTAEVFFLDFGNTESLVLSDLRVLPPEYLNLPAQAVSFSVSGISPVGGGEWSDDAITTFLELVIGKGLLCKVVGLDQDGYPTAQLRDPTARNTDIGSELVRLGLASGVQATASPAQKVPTPPSKSYQQNRPVNARGSSGSASVTSESPLRQEQSSREGSLNSHRSHSERSSLNPSPRGATPSRPSPSNKQVPKRPAYSCVKLAKGQPVEVIVTHVGSLTSFTCQTQASATQLQSLMDEIGKYCTSPQAKAVVAPTPKLPVLALYSLDECWYRAMIVSLSGDECTVSFVDYGDLESLPLSRTRQMPPHFLELPAQALECSLYNLTHNYHSSSEATVALVELVLEQCVSAVPRAPLSNMEGGWQVDLVTSEGSNVLEELTKLGHVPKARSPQSPVHKSAVNRATPVVLPVIPVGTPVDVVVSFVMSSAHFCVQLTESYTTLERIISGMQKVFQNPSNKIRAVDKPEIGMLCAAQFSEDKLWYRSKVMSISGKRATVCFVDFGNWGEVGTNDLKVLQREFTADPCGAIPCALAGIPAGATSDAMATKFEEMVLNQKLVAEFSGSLTSLDSPVPVRLIDTKRSGVDSDIARTLLEAVREKPRQLSVTIPSVEPQLNTLCECVIVHVISPGEFYCQLWLEADTHETLTNEMYSFYGENGQGSKVTKPTVGMYCIALFTDGSWYRALVTKEPRGVMVDVTYIDYGNSNQVEIQDLRKIEPQFTTQRAQAMQCHLAGIDPPSGQWPEESCSKMIESLIDEDVDVTFLANRGEGEGYATHVRHGGQDVAELLVKAGLAREKASEEQKASLASRASDAPKAVCQPTATPTARLSIPAFHLETGQECDVMVTSSGSPRDFYCQVVDEQLDQMMLEIEEYCLQCPPPPSSHRWSSGDAALGQFTEDQGWYRAVVTSVVDEGKLVKVRYVDYGNGESLPPSQLRLISPAFCQLPAFAIPCILQGVEQFDIAKDGDSTFNQLILDGEFHLRCVAVSETSQHCRIELEWKENGKSVLREAVGQGILQPKAAPVPANKPQGQPMGSASLSIPMMFPRVDESPMWTVYVVHCESPSLFYCQFGSQNDHDQLKSLMAALQEAYKQAPLVEASQLTTGSFVVAQFSEDEQWYRALVTSTTGNKVEVLFIDYGNRELLSLPKICLISKEFTHLPAQAIPCSLVAVEPLVGSDWSDESTEVFFNLVIEKAFVARVKSPGEKSGGGYSHGDGQSLALSLATSSTAEDDVAAEMVRLGQAKWSDVAVTSPSQSSVMAETIGHLPVLQIAPGSKEIVYVSHVESPSSFWVQLASSEETLNSLTDSLSAVYNSPDAPELIQPKTGDTCCARYSEYENWYRGIIRSCEGGVCHVRFVDYGNSEVVNAQDLRSLQSKFCRLRVEGILCSLASCSPITGSEWTGEAVSSFTSLVIDVPLEMEFITCTPQGVWEVRVQTEGGMDIGTQLVEMCVASSSAQEAATVAVESQVTQGAIEIPKLTLVVGQTYPMYMTHVVDPSEFYCQLATHSLTLDELMARVADYYTEHRPQAVLEVGRYCVAQYSGNNAWYRAKILQVTSSEDVSVYFVDYGNSEVVSTSQILAIVPEFATLASQAIPMCLPPEAVVQIESDQFFQLDLEQEFQVMPVTITDGKHIVKIQGDTATSLLLDAVLLPHPPAATPSEPTPASSGACSPLVYPLGSTVDIYVSHVNTPCSFYGQPLDLVEELEEMMTQLADQVTNLPPEQLKNPTLGQICLAKYSFDEEWYRARVEKFPSETEALVTFVDYGNSEVTSLGNLCVVPPSLMATQVQAIHCSVFEDLGSDWTWGEGTLEGFSSRTLQDGHFALTILSQLDDDQYLVEMCSDGHPIDFSYLLNGEEETRPQGPLDIPSSVLATTIFRPIPPEEGCSLHPSAEVSLVAVKGSKTPSTEVETESENGGEEGEGEGEPLIRAPYMMGLSRQEVFEAAVVHVQSPSLLYLQKVDCQPLVHALSDEINQYCASFPGRDFQHSFRAGDLVLAKYWFDESWYRAKVIEVHQEGSADVSFIDYGNMEAIDPHDMIMCPESFLDLPAQAIPCSLAHVPRREEEWPEGYKELIDGLVEKRVMRATVVVPGGQGMRPTVTLEDMESGVDVSSQVLTKLQEECEVGAQESVYAAGGSPLMDTRPEEVTGDETKEGSGEEGLVGSGEKELVPSEQQPVSRPTLPTRLFGVGDSCEVYLLACTSSHSFVCQLARDEETIDSITTHLCQLYGEDGKSRHPLKTPPVTGDVVCAQFSEDSQWYRALVMEVSEEQCEVLYVDFGNSETVTLDSFRELDESLSVHPPMALECFLHGVESSEKDGHFEDAAANRITELVGDDAATVEVVSIDSAGHLGVLLKNSEGVDVGADLISRKLASPLVPTPKASPPTPTLTSQEDMSASELTPRAPEDKEPVLESPSKGEDESPIPAPISEQSAPLPDEGAPIPDTCTLVSAGGQLSPPTVIPEEVDSEGDESEQEDSELLDSGRELTSSYPALTLPPGTQASAVVVSVTSPDGFVVQLTDNADAVVGLLDAIASEGYELGDSNLKVKAPKPGLPVCAYFAEDGGWYRARIVAVDETSHSVTVQYVDYGNSDTVSMDRVKQIKPQFADPLPPQAITCSLPLLTEHDLTPGMSMGGDVWELEWPPSCTQHLTEMVLDQEGLQLEVLDDSLTDGAYVVRIVDARGEQKFDVRERLVARLQEPKTLSLTPEGEEEEEEEEEEFHDALGEEGDGGVAGKMVMEETEEGDREMEDFEDTAQFVEQTQEGSMSPKVPFESEEGPVKTEESDTAQPTAGSPEETLGQEPEDTEVDRDATVPPLPTDSQPLEPTTEELKDSERDTDGLTDPCDTTGNRSPAPQPKVDVLQSSPGAESAKDTKSTEDDTPERVEGIHEQPGKSGLSTEEEEVKEQGEQEGGTHDEEEKQEEVGDIQDEPEEGEKQGGNVEGGIQDEREGEKENREELREQEDMTEGEDQDTEVKARAVDENKDELLCADNSLPITQSEQISQHEDNLCHSPPVTSTPPGPPPPGEVTSKGDKQESGDSQTSVFVSELQLPIEDTSAPIQPENNLTTSTAGHPKTEEASVEAGCHDNKDLGVKEESRDGTETVPKLKELASGAVKAVSDQDEATQPKSGDSQTSVFVSELQLPVEDTSAPIQPEKNLTTSTAGHTKTEEVAVEVGCHDNKDLQVGVKEESRDGTETVPKLKELASGAVKAVSDQDEATQLPVEQQSPEEVSKVSEKESRETETVPRLQELASAVKAVSDQDEATQLPVEQQPPEEVSKVSEKESRETETVPRLQELASGVVKEAAAVSNQDEATLPPSEEQLPGEVSKPLEEEVAQEQEGGKRDDSFEIISPSEYLVHQPQLLPPTTAKDPESGGVNVVSETLQEDLPDAQTLSLDLESAGDSAGQSSA